MGIKMPGKMSKYNRGTFEVREENCVFMVLISANLFLPLFPSVDSFVGSVRFHSIEVWTKLHQFVLRFASCALKTFEHLQGVHGEHKF
jgi:hypothetical protein